MARAFWRHATSGDVYAVELNDNGTAWGAVGPLYYSDVTQEYLDNLDVGSQEGSAEDAEWLNDQPRKIVKPTDYFQGDEPTCSICDAECSGHR